MASNGMVSVTYVGIFDEVDFYDGPYLKSVKNGQSIEVSPATAGSAPTDSDEGSGLLAQVANWVVTSTKSSKTQEG